MTLTPPREPPLEPEPDPPPELPPEVLLEPELLEPELLLETEFLSELELPEPELPEPEAAGVLGSDVDPGVAGLPAPAVKRLLVRRRIIVWAV